MALTPDITGQQAEAPVSVIIPCYNCAMTIERAIISVSGQTFRPLEVWLIDDASSDNTPEVLQKLSSRFGDWLRVVRLPKNSGPSTARNTGWNLASQPYIAFLDADDSWHPQKIELQYAWMAARPDVALTAHRYVVQDDQYRPAPATGLKSGKVSLGQLLLSNRFSTPTVMVRRNITERFQEGKRYAEDYLLWLSIAAQQDCYFLDASLTFLHKAPYGAAGLSAQMWAMEKGELDTFRTLCRTRKISCFALPALYLYSLSKFALRLVRRTLKGPVP